MTYAEYINLVKEYDSSDSVSRRKEITEEVYKAGVALAKQLEAMYNRYGAKFIDDDEYRSDRGGFSLIEFNKNKVYLRYSDHWKYGGECCFGISVPMKMLDVENRLAEMRSLLEKRISNLKKEFEDNLQRIDFLNRANTELLARIAQLEKERDEEK